MFALLVLVVCLEFLTLVAFVPAFRSFFSDFGAELPGFTKRVLELSAWMVGEAPGQRVPGAAIAGPIVAGLLVGLWALARKPSRRALATCISAVLFDVLLLAGIAAWISLVTAITLVSHAATGTGP